MAWFHGVVERRHDLQNPTSPEKIRLLGERLGLGPQSHVLDVASGRGGPAILLAQAFGCRITCVERAAEFDAAAHERVSAAGLDRLIDLVHADAREFPIEPGRYDAALCLGASFVWDGLGGTLAALTPAARRGGKVVVGEPYWRRWPLPADLELAPDETGFVTLAETVGRFEAAGLEPLALIDSSLDDWDRYESLQWLAADDWRREHPEDPGARELRARAASNRERYLGWQRELLGWAIVAARTP